jgi:hypothetical protein
MFSEWGLEVMGDVVGGVASPEWEVRCPPVVFGAGVGRGYRPQFRQIRFHDIEMLVDPG